SYWEPHTQLVPDALDTITDLRRRGYKIGVLSNTLWPASFHREVFRRDGLLDHIDAAVYSSEIPWTKPHPKAFQTLLDQLGVTDPERAVFVGDRLFDDIHGAKAVGMHAIYVPHSQIPTNQLGHTNGEPDAVIDRLADLLDILDGLPVA
ncbi:MAG TPA: HAD family hydrolase, partial [Acidimicrobiales bacterium]|nr:HAD family hydrolase [Acidimicrobiales bacterium]